MSSAGSHQVAVRSGPLVIPERGADGWRREEIKDVDEKTGAQR